MKQQSVQGIETEYVSLFKSVLAQVGSELSAIAIVTEMGKDRRQTRIEMSRQGQDKLFLSTRATQKQIDYLKALGIEVSDDISKAEASRLLDETLGQMATTAR